MHNPINDMTWMLHAVMSGKTTNPLVFHAPLDSRAQTATTGQALTYNDATYPTVATKDGLQCLYFPANSNSYVFSEDVTDIPTENSSFTISIWMWLEDNQPECHLFGFGEYGGTNATDYFVISNVYGTIKGGYGGLGDIQTSYNYYKQWNHVVVTYDSETSVGKLYINNTLQTTENPYYDTPTIVPSLISIGGSFSEDDGYFMKCVSGAYLLDARIYNYAMDATEVTGLYQEHIPMPEIAITSTSISLKIGIGGFKKVGTSITPCIVSIVSGTLPSGLTFGYDSIENAYGFTLSSSATGIEGAYSFTLKASQPGYTDSQNTTVTVNIVSYSEVSGDLVFYAPLDSYHAKSESVDGKDGGYWGGDWQQDGFNLVPYEWLSNSSQRSTSITYSIVDGIPCAYFGRNKYLSVTNFQWTSWSQDHSFSWWTRFDTGDYERGMIGDCKSSTPATDNFRISVLSSGKIETTMSGTFNGRFVSTGTISTQAWHHFAIVYVNNESKIYVYLDGSLLGNASAGSTGSSTGGDNFSIGRARDIARGQVGCNGCMAAVRVYNRALSASEVLMLSNEF